MGAAILILKCLCLTPVQHLGDLVMFVWLVECFSRCQSLDKAMPHQLYTS